MATVVKDYGDFLGSGLRGYGNFLTGGGGGSKQRDQRPARERDETGAIAMLGDAYGGGQSGTDFLSNLLNNFRGDWNELEKFMELAGPMINKLEGGFQAGKMEGGDAFKYMADQGNWDMGALSSYGREAGQIGASTRTGIRDAQQGMGAAGMGRSSMRNALASTIRQQGVTAQSNAFSAAQQRAQQNRMGSAMNLMDAQRMIAQVALGQQITPRIPGGGDGGGGPSAGAGAAAGAMSGAAAGTAVMPGWGTAVGAVAGGVGGYLGAR